jgi:hypothetical protein
MCHQLPKQCDVERALTEYERAARWALGQLAR